MSDDSTSDDTNPHGFGEAVEASSHARPKPGDIIIDPDLGMAPEPLVGDDASTPLEEDEDGTEIPPGPLWAMKDRRHIQWHLLALNDRHPRIRETLGTGDTTLYAIDDGRHHAMIARSVGSTHDGVTYSLVGRITRERLDALRTDQGELLRAFDDAQELTLCGAAAEDAIASSNVFDVSRYGSSDEIPTEYLPGHAATIFARDLEITIY